VKDDLFDFSFDTAWIQQMLFQGDDQIPSFGKLIFLFQTVLKWTVLNVELVHSLPS